MSVQQDHGQCIQCPLFPPQHCERNCRSASVHRILPPIRSTKLVWQNDPSYYNSPYALKLHHAGRPHLDFRLCLHWIALSWALYSFPSHCPKQGCIAIQVEDHLRENLPFEGVHPEGKHGAGPTITVNQGLWRPLPEYLDICESRRLGCIRFLIESELMRGIWTLTRNEDTGHLENPRWLLQKEPDEFALAKDPMDTSDWTKLTSCQTGQTLEETKSNFLLGNRHFRASELPFG